jgi:hypothetical protein
MEIGSIMKKYLPIFAGAIPVFLLSAFHITEVNPILVLAVLVFLAFLLSVYINEKVFKAAAPVVLGAFLAITLDIIIFPTVDGYERNLFPLEIVFHIGLCALVCYGSACAWEVANVIYRKRT